MRKIITLSIVLGLGVLGLTGCPGENNVVNTTNRTNVNAANGNTAVVVNSNGNTPPGINSTSNGNTMGMDASPTDMKGFMTRAAQGGMAEVQLGQMASQKAQNPEVKKFGQKMVQDHTNANTELKALAAKKNVTLPTELDAEHKALMTRLQGLSGAEFDKAYMDAMVDDHEKTVDLFQNQADDGDDADVKAFASKTLPNLKAHLQMAKDINGKLK